MAQSTNACDRTNNSLCASRDSLTHAAVLPGLLQWGWLVVVHGVVLVCVVMTVYSRDYRWGEFVPVGVVNGLLIGLLCGWRKERWRGMRTGSFWGGVAGVTDLGLFWLGCVATNWPVEWLVRLPVFSLVFSVWLVSNRSSRSLKFWIIVGMVGTEMLAGWYGSELLSRETFRWLPGMKWRLWIVASVYCATASLYLAFATPTSHEPKVNE